MPGVTTYSDEDRARLAIFADGRWLGPKEVERCPHGRFLSFRWSVSGVAETRPTAQDFQGSDLDHVGGSCRKCHPEDE